jgi:hypothetical protein
MNTRHIQSIVARIAVGAACVITSASCGSDLLRTGRAPSYLLVQSIQGQASGGTATSGLLSDVQVLVDQTVNGVTVKVPTFFNDNAIATLRVDLKNPTIAATAINAVTVTRYDVVFKRSDGRNTPGVDVPYPFSGATSVTIDAGGTGDVAFELVRHEAKLEPPLRNLVGLGGIGFISTIAEITFYGRDQNGNEVVASGSLDVQFGDFADKAQ